MEIHDSRPVDYRWHIMMMIYGIFGIFADTWVWTEQNYFLMLWGLIISITIIHFYLELQARTSPNFCVSQVTNSK